MTRKRRECLVFMALQTAYWFGIIDPGEGTLNKQMKHNMKLIFTQCEFANVPNDWKYIVDLESTNGPDENGYKKGDTRNSIFEVWQKQGGDRIGFSVQFTIDFSNLLAFYENFYTEVEDLSSFRMSATQINTTYGKKTKSENVGIFMGLSIIDAIYRQAREIKLGNNTKPTGLELISGDDQRG